MSANTTRPVLVVEGDDILQRVLAEILDDLGYPSLIVADVPAALHALEHSLPAVVLLDMDHLPDQGESLAREIRSRYGDRLPLIIVGPYHEAARLAESVGTAAALEKPFTIDRLERLVSQFARR